MSNNGFDFLRDGVKKLAEAQALVDSAREKILLLIDEYNIIRQELLIKALEKEKLRWCSRCKSFTGDKLTLVLTHGKRRENCGYEDSCYSYNSFRETYGACEKCKVKLLSGDGSYGPYDHQARDQSSFHACIIEETDLLEEDYSPPLCPKIDETMEARWKIPPLIEITSNQICYRENNQFIPIPEFKKIDI